MFTNTVYYSRSQCAFDRSSRVQCTVIIILSYCTEISKPQINRQKLNNNLKRKAFGRWRYVH